MYELAEPVYPRAVEIEGHPDNVAAELHGGFVICTVRESVLDKDGFLAKFAELERAGRWTPIRPSG